MPKVVCKLPNASTLINGFGFTPTKNGKMMVSEDLSDDDAAHFASIAGYEIIADRTSSAVQPVAGELSVNFVKPGTPAAEEKKE